MKAIFVFSFVGAVTLKSIIIGESLVDIRNVNLGTEIKLKLNVVEEIVHKHGAEQQCVNKTMSLNVEKNLVMRERANMVAQSLTVLFLSKEPWG